MEFFDAVERRKSIRAFLPDEIGEEKLEKLLGAVSLAPSAGNMQAYRIAVVKSKRLQEEIAEAALGQEFLAQAPVLMVFLADRKRSASKYGKRGEGLYSVQDATIAAAYCQLAACALGLGSVWVGAFDEGRVASLLKAQEGEVPIAIIPVGYPAEEVEGHQRRKIGSIAREL